MSEPKVTLKLKAILHRCETSTVNFVAEGFYGEHIFFSIFLDGESLPELLKVEIENPYSTCFKCEPEPRHKPRYSP